jgi:hypothetical protein
MRVTLPIVVAFAMLNVSAAAQEAKPVPKGSVRVSVPGCAKDYIFTAGRRTADEAGKGNVPEGMHLRMSAPKKMVEEINAHKGSMIEITGTMKEGQFKDGVNLGGGVRLGPGVGPTGGSPLGNPIANQIMIDVEGWRPIAGTCTSR